MSTKEELINRWDAFLKQIENRFNESLKMAEEACTDQLIESNYEYFTVINAWGGMKSQIDDLIEKIDNTWDNKVKEKMKDAGIQIHDYSIKGRNLNDKLHYELNRFQRDLQGRLSMMCYNNATKSVNKVLKCTQCNGAIEIAENIFREHYITCSFCQSTNTYFPEARYLQAAWLVDNIAAYNTNHLYDAMEKQLEIIHNQRPPVNEILWDNYKAAYIQYHESFFKEKMKYNDDIKDGFQQYMDRKKVEYQNYENIYKKA